MAEVADVRVLVPGDEPRLFELLEQHVDSSLFLFSNVESVGLVDAGKPLHATYVGSFDPTGRMTAVAGHAWNGNLLVQGGEGLERAAQLAVSASGRQIRGVIGPWAQVVRTRSALGVAATPAAHDERERLYGLALSALRPPELLARGDVRLRPPTAAEAAGVVCEWRVDYCVEALGAERDARLEASAREGVAAWLERGRLWVLEVGGVPVTMTGFNAESRGIVQIGGVFTPRSQRRRGYARAAVAASLQLAREEGATRSILFTNEDNVAARRAYEALGYEHIGDFGLVLFDV